MTNHEFTYKLNLFETNPTYCELEHLILDTDGTYDKMKDELDLEQSYFFSYPQIPSIISSVTIKPKIPLAAKAWKQYDFALKIKMVRNVVYYPQTYTDELVTLYAGCGDWTLIHDDPLQFKTS